MREPDFWWQPPGAAATILVPVAAVYGAIAGARMTQTGQAAGIPVICVGNLTLGGAGKTPTAIALTRVLTKAGRAPFILSRGYGGSQSGPLRVDPDLHRARDVGDEPLLLARHAPVIVARDRTAGAQAARMAGADMIVMDDGFQNPSLQKDFSLVVVEARRGIGNGRVFPAGPLRAPLATQLDRADAVLIVGDGTAAHPIADAMAMRQKPVFHGRLQPDADIVRELKNRRVLAFAGIANPDKFFATLQEVGIAPVATHVFQDHHRYTAAEAENLFAQASRDSLVPVTTEKDWVRMQGEEDVAVLAKATRTLPVTLAIRETDALRRCLLEAAAGRARGATQA